MSLRASASNTIGPFFQIGLEDLYISEIATADVDGARITVQGRLLDGDSKPISDGLIEIWQANSHGKYLHPEDTQDKPILPGFKGFGRIATDDNGMFRFITIKPGPVPGPNDSLQAPHLLVSIFMRGLTKRLVTRMYFPGEPGNANDAVLSLVPAPRRPTLIAHKNPGDDALEWNIVVQGPNETVFFDC